MVTAGDATEVERLIVTLGGDMSEYDAILTRFEDNTLGAAKRISASVDDMTKQQRDLMREAAKLTEALATPTEQYAGELAKLDQMLDSAYVSQETYNRALAALDAELGPAISAEMRATDATLAHSDALQAAQEGFAAEALAAAEATEALRRHAEAAAESQRVSSGEGIIDWEGLLGQSTGEVGNDGGGAPMKQRPQTIEDAAGGGDTSFAWTDVLGDSFKEITEYSDLTATEMLAHLKPALAQTKEEFYTLSDWVGHTKTMFSMFDEQVGASADDVMDWSMISGQLRQLGPALAGSFTAVTGVTLGTAAAVVAVGAAALGTAAYLAWGSEGLGAAWDYCTQKAGDFVDGTMGFFENWRENLGAIIDWLPNHWDEVLLDMAQMFGVLLVNLPSMVMTGLETIVRLVTAWQGWITGMWQQVFSVDFLVAIYEGGKKALLFFADLGGQIWLGITNALQGKSTDYSDFFGQMDKDFAAGASNVNIFETMGNILEEQAAKINPLEGFKSNISDPLNLNLSRGSADPSKDLEDAEKAEKKLQEQVESLNDSLNNQVDAFGEGAVWIKKLLDLADSGATPEEIEALKVKYQNIDALKEEAKELEANKKERERATEEMDKLNAAVEFEALTLGMSKNEIKLYKAELAGLSDAKMEEYAAALQAKEAFDADIKAQKEATKEAEKQRKESEKNREELDSMVATVGMSSEELKLYKAAMMGASSEELRYMKSKLDMVKVLKEEQKEKERAKKLEEKYADPTTKMVEGEAKLRKMLDEGNISVETYGKALEELQKDALKGVEVKFKHSGLDALEADSAEAVIALEQFRRDAEGAVALPKVGLGPEELKSRQGQKEVDDWLASIPDPNAQAASSADADKVGSLPGGKRTAEEAKEMVTLLERVATAVEASAEKSKSETGRIVVSPARFKR